MEDLFEQVGSALCGPQFHFCVSRQMHFDRNLFLTPHGHGLNEREMGRLSEATKQGS